MHDSLGRDSGPTASEKPVLVRVLQLHSQCLVGEVRVDVVTFPFSQHSIQRASLCGSQAAPPVEEGMLLATDDFAAAASLGPTDDDDDLMFEFS